MVALLTVTAAWVVVPAPAPRTRFAASCAAVVGTAVPTPSALLCKAICRLPCRNSRSTRRLSLDNALLVTSASLPVVEDEKYPRDGSEASAVNLSRSKRVTPFTASWLLPPIGLPQPGTGQRATSIGQVQLPTEYGCPFGHLYQPTWPDASRRTASSSSGMVGSKQRASLFGVHIAQWSQLPGNASARTARWAQICRCSAW